MNSASLNVCDEWFNFMAFLGRGFMTLHLTF